MSRHLALLQPAVGYALDALDAVTPSLLSRPTPCAKWNLGMLLNHTSASAAALQEGFECGRVGLFPVDRGDDAGDPAGLARARIKGLFEQCNVGCDGRSVAVADRRMPVSLIVDIATVEIAVHGWDVYQASGRNRPIPADLAAGLLGIAGELLADGNRADLFAAPLPASPSAGPCERLLAFLGRRSPA